MYNIYFIFILNINELEEPKSKEQSLSYCQGGETSTLLPLLCVHQRHCCRPVAFRGHLESVFRWRGVLTWFGRSSLASPLESLAIAVCEQLPRVPRFPSCRPVH